MTGFLGVAWPWVKAAHVIFVIFWMAGLFILPRYLVHHQEALGDPVQAKAWAEREAKLRRVILVPSMTVVWILGVALAINLGLFEGGPGLGWLHAKLLLVLIMSGVHGFLSKTVKVFAADQNVRPAKFYRMINEVPTVLMIGIVILVIVKPF